MDAQQFPHPCGDSLEAAVNQGADPSAVVPDYYVIGRGGTSPIDPAGGTFSGTAGPSAEVAACALPHGQVRFSTAAAIRAAGEIVRWVPEISRRGTLNKQHVDVTLAENNPFSDLQPNPVPRELRIDGKPQGSQGQATP